jgi:predicted AAA+ superfamily ATPase
MKALFQRLITDFQESKPKSVVERDYKIPLDSPKIVSLIGVRRCGKTHLCYGLINELRKTVDPHNVLYLNFEDDRLMDVTLADLDNLMEGYYALYPDKRDEQVYLFLDEVQNIPNWERYIRRIHDTLNVRIFVTGSSSRLLSKEIATSLRGRTLTYEIFPFSFAEYLRFHAIEVNLNSSKSISYIENAFARYLTQGGFAETFEQDADIQQRIWRDYLDLIIYRDLIERYDIKNTHLLRHLIKYSLSNIGTLVSINKLFNEYKGLGHRISKDTLYQYFTYLEDAYALFSVPIFRNSVQEEQRKPRKIYAIDNGFKTLLNTSLSSDLSKLYENVVFLQLRRHHREVYYYKEVQEVDFYVPGTQARLVNVSVNIEGTKTYDREINGLLEAMKYMKLDRAELVTQHRHEQIEIEGKRIDIVPLWRWLLSEPEGNLKR